MLSQDELRKWEEKFRTLLINSEIEKDPAHDLAHFERVVTTARKLALEEGARLEVVIPAAWLHDLVNVPKNDPLRSQASRLSAEAAVRYLGHEGYPHETLPAIAHAVAAHSYSAGIEPESLEAKIVQDADRLDALGAIGIARCFAVTGLLKRQIYSPLDPFARDRALNDLEFAVDHFFVKLLKLPNSLQTRSGRHEGLKRAQYMRDFLGVLGQEIGAQASGPELFGNS